MKYNLTISDVTRAYVLLLGKEKKYSCRVIAKKANISKSSVSLILRENGKRKHYFKRDNKIGRPHKLTEKDRRKLIRSIQTLRHEDPNFTVKQLLAKSGLLSQKVSYRTIYREVKSAGFQFLPVRKKGVLTSRDRKKRKAFAKECNKILSAKPNFFSRDIAFYLDGVSFVHKTQPLSDALAPKGCVWKKRTEDLQVTAKGMYVCVCKTLFQHAIFVNYLHQLVSTKGVLCTLNLKYITRHTLIKLLITNINLS